MHGYGSGRKTSSGYVYTSKRASSHWEIEFRLMSPLVKDWAGGNLMLILKPPAGREPETLEKPFWEETGEQLLSSRVL